MARATGTGPWPGTDPAAAIAVVVDTVPALPFLPQLPQRGPGADAVGRTAATLVDLHVDLQPTGWRLVDRAGRDERRARDLWARDLDALEEVAPDHEGPWMVSLLGPWTMAAELHLARGEKALADIGAVRDVAASLAEGIAAVTAAVRRRLPSCNQVVVQLDEPRLPAVLAGDVPNQSGWSRLAAVERPMAQDALGTVLAAAERGGVRCNTDAAPVDVLSGAGAAFIGLDARHAVAVDDEGLGGAVEAGAVLHLGLVPATDGRVATLEELAAPARALWRRLSLPVEDLDRAVVVTYGDGLEVCSTSGARRVLATCAALAEQLVEVAAATDA